MSGLLPIELSYLSNLKAMNLSSQIDSRLFQGPLLALANSPNVAYIDLHANAFAGGVPSNLLAATGSDDTVVVDLSFNRLSGSVPILSASNLEIHLQANRFDSLPHELCNSTTINVPYRCDAILCRPGTAAPTGRATTSDSCMNCKSRNEAPYYGSVICDSTQGLLERKGTFSRPVSGFLVSATPLTM